ncbi:MAG: YcgL domain-containing protein [Aestuariibacter sp.]
MLCAIFKSQKKPDTYLYVKDRHDLSDVPADLLTMFGKPVFVMLFNLDGNKQLINKNNQTVKTEIQDKGFYLQLPPPVENLLSQHTQQLKGK